MAIPLPQVTAKKTVPVLKDFTCFAPIKMLGNNHGENKATTRQITFTVVNNCLIKSWLRRHRVQCCTCMGYPGALQFNIITNPILL